MDHKLCCRTAFSFTPFDKLRINFGAKARRRMGLFARRRGGAERLCSCEGRSLVRRSR